MSYKVGLSVDLTLPLPDLLILSGARNEAIWVLDAEKQWVFVLLLMRFGGLSQCHRIAEALGVAVEPWRS